MASAVSVGADTAQCAYCADAASVRIAMVCDRAFTVPTLAAIESIARTRNAGTNVEVRVVAADCDGRDERILAEASRPGLSVSTVRACAGPIAGIHRGAENGRSASVAALLKFFLPGFLPDWDRCLYLDGDVIVRRDLSALFSADLGGRTIGAVRDPGPMYLDNPFAHGIPCYFNSGVMVMDLARMRRSSAWRRLAAWKRRNPGDPLRDQNALNAVFAGDVAALHPRWNCLYANLLRSHANGSWGIAAFNRRYGTDYASLVDIGRDAAIVHFVSTVKPWKFTDAPLAAEWMAVWRLAPASGKIRLARKDSGQKWTRPQKGKSAGKARNE